MPESVLITPFDEHNQRLVDQVHPSSWANPEPAELYHLVVIGAGTAGLVAAAAVAGLGGRVALIERHLMGGDCLNVGCVPSKALIRSARAWKEVAAAAAHGLRAGEMQRDFGAAMKRVRELRAGLAANDSAARFRELGVDAFFGHGRFVSPHEATVEGRRLRFHRALVATGSRPAVPEVAGLAEGGFLTNESVFSLQHLPNRLAVVGGGPLGCELAQAFARFGSQVTLLLRERHLLPREESETVAVVERALVADGVRMVGGCRLVAVDRSVRSKVLRFAVGADEHRLAVDEILIATGRRPNVEDLGLEAAGIAATAEGIRVDDHLRTSNAAVFAAGDVASDYKFTHAADALARIVVRNALFRGRERASDLLIPWTTFTSPEVARVGPSAEQLRERGVRFETLDLPIAENDRARLEGSTEGFLRLHHRKGKGEILGATLVSEHAGESIGELVLAMRAGLGLADLAATIHPYPTQAEVLKRAGDLWRRKKLTPTARKLFAFWFRRLEAGARKRIAKATAAAGGQ
jgi:pyruvate/2-oxoglutarate dehydrogenase complex dihydrolipoamide dehydrogenase (E3) component